MCSKQRHSTTSRLPLALSLLILGGAVAAYFVLPGFHAWINEAFAALTSGDPQRTREWVGQFGAWGPVAIVVIMVLQMFLFVVPNIILILITVLSYGPVWGTLLALFANFVASTVGYFIGQKLSHVIVDRLVSPRTQQRLRDFIRDYGAKAVFALRLSSFSNDGLSLVAGLLKMRYRRFILASLAGITPLILVLALFGHNGQIERGLLVIGVTTVIFLAIYIVIDRKRKARKPVGALPAPRRTAQSRRPRPREATE